LWKKNWYGGSRFIAFLAFLFLLYSDASIFDQWRFSPQPLGTLTAAIKDEKVNKLRVSDREIRAFYKTGERTRTAKEPNVSLSETLRPYNLNGSFEKIAVDYSSTSFFYEILRWLILISLLWYSMLRPMSQIIDLMTKNGLGGGLGGKKTSQRKKG
jgi:hypothetical protein